MTDPEFEQTPVEALLGNRSDAHLSDGLMSRIQQEVPRQLRHCRWYFSQRCLPLCEPRIAHRPCQILILAPVFGLWTNLLDCQVVGNGNLKQRVSLWQLSL